jgi:hypothetical protein
MSASVRSTESYFFKTGREKLKGEHSNNRIPKHGPYPFRSIRLPAEPISQSKSIPNRNPTRQTDNNWYNSVENAPASGAVRGPISQWFPLPYSSRSPKHCRQSIRSMRFEYVRACVKFLEQSRQSCAGLAFWDRVASLLIDLAPVLHPFRSTNSVKSQISQFP